MNFKPVFDTKRLLITKEPYQLEGLIRDIDPTIHIANNGDRTFSIYFINGQNVLDSIICKAMVLWFGELSFNPILLYNLFDVGDNNYVLRI